AQPKNVWLAKRPCILSTSSLLIIASSIKLALDATIAKAPSSLVTITPLREFCIADHTLISFSSRLAA
ncbi:hypothetical protein Tco_0028034, partial [Tanacetum coccineum]